MFESLLQTSLSNMTLNVYYSILLYYFIDYCHRRADDKYSCLALKTCMEHRQP